MPILVSHRGLHDVYPENTLQAFDEAVASGFRYLETDLRCTKDGHIVLSHDRSLRRISGHDLLVDQVGRKDIERLKLAEGTKILFFEDFLERFGYLNLTLDIKGEGGEATVEALSTLIRPEQKLRFLFWQKAQEQAFTHRFPQAALYARYDQCVRAGLAVVFGVGSLFRMDTDRVYALPEYYKGIRLFKKSYVQAFHKHNVKVCAFLPSNGDAFNLAVECGFDEVLCDRNFSN